MTLNRPNPRLQILRAQLAAEADAVRMQRASYKISNAVGCSCPVPAPDADSLPLPPSYWDDLEHWLKTLAPAKPAATDDAYVSAKQPEPDADVWHSEPPRVAGVYQCLTDVLHVGEWYSHYDGQSWSGLSARSSGPSKADHRNRIVTKTCKWLRLIEADNPAQQPAQKASTHSVCIKAHGVWKVGEVTAWTRAKPGFPECWLPCDESGWVTHVPTADSVCPVPEGLDFAAMWGDGNVSGLGPRYFREHVNTWRSNHIHGGLRAWRPIAQS